jgi:hypothetical protein
MYPPPDTAEREISELAQQLGLGERLDHADCNAGAADAAAG